MTNEKKKKIRLVLIGALILAGGILYAIMGSRGQETFVVERTVESRLSDSSRQPAESEAGMISEEGTTSGEEESSGPPDIFVHVCGGVAHPDHVYRLPAGSRVEDAVNAAGGPEPDAALRMLNLAAFLSDGQRIYVPAEGEESFAQAILFPEIITEESSGSHLTDLNKASKIELEELPGIGPALAERIIAYRMEHGGFSNVEELLNVKGIGSILFSRLQSLITAGTEA